MKYPRILLLMFYLFSTTVAFANINDDDDEPAYSSDFGPLADPPTDDPPIASIDIWIPILIIVALTYAFYRYKQLAKINKISN